MLKNGAKNICAELVALKVMKKGIKNASPLQSSLAAQQITYTHTHTKGDTIYRQIDVQIYTLHLNVTFKKTNVSKKTNKIGQSKANTHE